MASSNNVKPIVLLAGGSPSSYC